MSTLTSIYDRFADIYDLASTDLSEATWELGIIRAMKAAGTTGKTALDLGCGTGIGGRLMQSLGLASIAGIDQSSEMLRAAAPFYSRLYHCDLLDSSRAIGQFDFIVAGFDTLNYLSPTALEAAFRLCIDRFNGTDARLVFDYSSPALLREHWRDRHYTQHLDKGRSLRWSHTFDNVSNTCTTRIALLVDGEKFWTETHVQYTMSRSEMIELAQASGLALKSTFDVRRDEGGAEAHTHLYVFGQGR